MVALATPRPTRRALLGAGAALGAAAPLLLAASPLPAAAAADAGEQRLATGTSAAAVSAQAALRFLQQVTDAYVAKGPRLAQSFDDSRISDIAFVYDNALTCMALLAAGDRPRARAIGDALLYAQAHDPEQDGRLRQTYHAGAFVNADQTPNPGWEYGLTGTAVGDMAWTGLAFAQLAHKTGSATYLQGMLRVARWIVDHTRTDAGLGGFTFGETAGLEGHKSTEHNIDVHGFFRLVATLTRDRSWSAQADHAKAFVHAVWNAEDGFFWTGSDDGASVNKAPAQLPLDVQTWYWLSLGDRRYRHCLDWALGSLRTTDTPVRPNSSLSGSYAVTGVGFGSGTFRTDISTTVGGHPWTPKPDDGAVWFEGTGQLALALHKRNAPDDRAQAATLMAAIRSTQGRLGAGQTFHGKKTTGGIVAASSPLDTGFGFDYSQNLHVAATSWYLFAAMRSNPYRF